MERKFDTISIIHPYCQGFFDPSHLDADGALHLDISDGNGRITIKAETVEESQTAVVFRNLKVIAWGLYDDLVTKSGMDIVAYMLLEHTYTNEGHFDDM